MKIIIASILLLSSSAFAGDWTELSQDSSAYLISNVGQENTPKQITIRVFDSEVVFPTHFYMLYYPGGQDAGDAHQEQIARLNSELKRLGIRPYMDSGGSWRTAATVKCSRDVCAVETPE